MFVSFLAHRIYVIVTEKLILIALQGEIIHAYYTSRVLLFNYKWGGTYQCSSLLGNFLVPVQSWVLEIILHFVDTIYPIASIYF